MWARAVAGDMSGGLVDRLLGRPSGVGADDGPEADGYNYRHFRFAAYEGTRRNVRAGDPAPDGTLYTLDGDEVTLAGLWRERPAVVEFGSVTCPIFTEKVDRMDALARRYEAVDFYVVYVREAHPGRRCPPHGSFEEKARRAREVREGVERTVLVDDLEGSVHRAFDALPNSVSVVGTDGIVSYRADWLEPAALEDHLRRLLAGGGRGADVPPTDLTGNFHRPTPARLRALVGVARRAGLDSLRDFLASAPRMVRYRIRQRSGGSD